jgi:hypothetical protein
MPSVCRTDLHSRGHSPGAVTYFPKGNSVIFKTAEEARVHVRAAEIVGDRFELAISDDFTFAGRRDTMGMGMALVLDAILAKGLTVDGFEQRDGYRLYRYKAW